MKLTPLNGSSCAAVCALLAGCLMVPYKPKAQVTPVAADLYDAEHIVLTIGPRRLLHDIGKEITNLDPQIQLVDSLTLRDALFPSGGWTLATLLNEANRPILAASGAEYLAIIGQPSSEKTKSVGAFGFYMGFAGALKETEQSSIAIMLVDLKQGRMLNGADIRADGTTVALGAFYALIVVPRMDASLHEGVGSAIVQAIRKARPNASVKVGLLAMENASYEAAEAKEAAEARHAELLKYAWMVAPTPEDWQAAFSRLGPEEQAHFKGAPISFGVSGPAADGKIYYRVNDARPTDRIESGVDRLDIAAICDGFNRSFGNGSNSRWEITEALSFEKRVNVSGGAMTTRFELSWNFRDPNGRAVSASATDAGLGTKVGILSWKHAAKQVGAETNQAFALTFLKLVLSVLRESAPTSANGQ